MPFLSLLIYRNECVPISPTFYKYACNMLTKLMIQLMELK